VKYVVDGRVIIVDVVGCAAAHLTPDNL